MNVFPHNSSREVRKGVFDLPQASSRSRRAGRDGFTLVELLVVISITAVLIALSMGAATKVRDQSKTTRCIANLRWAGSAMLHYITEQNGVYENWMAGSSKTIHYWTWYMRYRAYYSEDELLRHRCPSGPFDNTVGGRTGSHYGFYTEDPHGSRFQPGNPPEDATTAYRIRINTHPKPGSSPMMGDSLSDSTKFMTHTLRNKEGVKRGGFYALHNGRVNVFFLDGHVESATPGRMRELGIESMFDQNQKIITTPLK